MSDEPCGSCGGPDCRLRTDIIACCPECTHRSEYQRGWHDGYKAALRTMRDKPATIHYRSP